ncbi:hypothetical protein FOVG_08407 [Fusarium oxysporum f. sp. pisi HDV247]|uniref:IDI-2 n=1 Tax=Fusarium oxysporum f. sp. pisi HDV247 TaxID=1080344 RepID=W9PUQ0_FUSOX|nr:hypothetical protein FOVG_08407 [Fusarium oxysporum f. sp. pisi HDV247]
MKTSSKLGFILVCTAMSSAGIATENPYKGIEAICGDLGVMDIAPGNLPEAVQPWEVRLCVDHTLGRDRELDPENGASLAPSVKEEGPSLVSKRLFEKKCSFSAEYGCSKRYCWKQCGKNGEWCWTAVSGGTGPWRGCHSWQDCGMDDIDYGCGRNCKKHPEDCKCSC